MKVALEVAVAIFVHPLAVILCLLDILKREELKDVNKVIWGLVLLIWGLGPILYIFLADGEMWSSS